MMRTCIAVDDEPLALELIKHFIARIDNLQLLGVFEDGKQAEIFLQNQSADLMFLDVDMPDINGITLVKRLPKKPLLILTTAYRNYAYDGYELDAVDFLLKPFDFERFSKAVDKAFLKLNLLERERPLFISVYSEYQLIKINLEDIEYLEAMEDYVRIHLLQGKTILTLSTLKGILERLPSDQFVRVHRSYGVALRYVQSFSNRKIKLSKVEIKVGYHYLEETARILKR